MAEAIFQWDSGILLWIQDSLRTGFLTPVMNVITHLGDKGILWILLTIALLIVRKTRRLGVLCAFSMFLGLFVTNLVIKNWVARVRPYELINGLECLVGVQKDFSFPSGHTTNSIACAWVLFRRAPKKWGVPALVMAVLISLSRLYVGVHYPTDVIGGAIIGLCCACLSLWLVPKAEKALPELANKFYKL